MVKNKVGQLKQIAVRMETLSRLQSLKLCRRDAMNDVIERLLDRQKDES